MRFSVLTILAAGASTAVASNAIYARQEIGTFDTFTNEDCSEGGKGIDVTDEIAGYTPLDPDVLAIDSHLPENYTLIISDSVAVPLKEIRIGYNITNSCVPLRENNGDLVWNVIYDY